MTTASTVRVVLVKVRLACWGRRPNLSLPSAYSLAVNFSQRSSRPASPPKPFLHPIGVHGGANRNTIRVRHVLGFRDRQSLRLGNEYGVEVLGFLLGVGEGLR